MERDRSILVDDDILFFFPFLSWATVNFREISFMRPKLICLAQKQNSRIFSYSLFFKPQILM